MSHFDLVVRSGLLVGHDQVVAADLGVRDGRVAAVGTGLAGADEEVDASGLWVLPGLVDPHVHLRDPGMTDKEDFGTGTAAAAVGGVTTVLDMPNTIPPVATPALLAEKRDRVAPKAHVDFGLYGLLDQESSAAMAGFAAQGAAGVKLFMGQTTGDNPCPDDGAIFAGLRAAGAAGLVVGVHAENNPLLQRLAAELRAAGRTDPHAHLESRPSVVEAEAVQRVLTLASVTDAHVHIHHLSSADGLAAFRRARRAGARASCEALVAHLLLDERAYEEHGNLVKLNPPIRARADVDALRAALLGGEVDCVATDHAPHTAVEQAEVDVWRAHGGFIGVETLLPLLLTQVAAGWLGACQLVRLTSLGPARIWGLYPRKGHLGLGADADLVLVDPAREATVRPELLHSKHPVTPFAGWPLVGAPVATYLRGRLVARDGALVGRPTGRFVAPARLAGLLAGERTRA